MSLFQKFQDRPDLALEFMFSEPSAILFGRPAQVFIWTGCADKEGVRYGSYKTVRKDSLVNREYIVDWSDYKPSIFYTDVWHNPRTNKNEPKDLPQE